VISDHRIPAENATVTNLDFSQLTRAPDEAPAIGAGVVLSDRYEIIQLLGQGGMGSVYKARDIELDRVVALKVIRPELADEQTTLKRFKQELILARQVTHKNVIRIFDFGSHQNIKYITMEYVEGRDLATILEERRFSPEEAARIIRQVCRALEAAHAENVIHRDLKPHNILCDETGRVRVMDFGLARLAEVSDLTRTGVVLGTPAYMSPEQARGVAVDARSDIFSLGIVLYQLLAGQVPFRAETVWAMLLARTQAPPPPPTSFDPGVPGPLSDITMKCLAIDPASRYQSAAEVAADLDLWLGDAQHGSIVFAPTPAVPLRQVRNKWRIAAVAFALFAILAIAGGLWLQNRGSKRLNTISVLVGDFTNHTGDPIFDNTLEPMFNIALEGASFVNTFNRGDARKLARQLPNPTNKLDEQAARLIAVSQGLGAVVTGSLSRRGDGYKLSAEAIDAVSGKTIGDGEISVSSKDEISRAIPKLAAPIRKALGDTTPESVQLEAVRGTFTAASLEAVHQYGVAMEQQFAGKMEDALQSFSKAAELDPNFARAYSGMAGTSANLNRPQDAEKYLQLAMEHVDRMSERERYRTRGLYYRRIGDLTKCVEEYSQLVKQYPADNIGHQNLANCYSDLRNMASALEEERQAVQISPKSAMQRKNLALIAAYAGDFKMSEREAREALQLNPSYERAYLPLAYAQILQGQVAQAAETYHQLERVSPLGASFAASGLADLALYEGRFSDAVRILEKGVAADMGATNLLAAEKFAALAYVQVSRGQKKLALEAVERAQASKKANIRFLAARIVVAAGDIAKARSLAAGLASDSQPEPQADAKLIQGEIALQSANPHEAIKTITEANSILDTWIGRFDLGRAYLEAGQFTEADSEFDKCLKRRGEALELDDGPSYGYFPAVYYYQGRVREGLKSPGAAESYRTYLNIRGRTGEDPLLPEIRRRVGL
jgi:tetratricopeptide (TPR) repeat protein/tRNA A-37 threonylcarbamoyl transferase component Bud32